EEDRDFSDWQVLKDAAATVGIDAESVRAAGPDDDELDAMVVKNTEAAVSRGVFGAPSYVFEDGEVMWGQDRVHFVAKKIASLS
ncbi:MAG: DsbA family protein, partial [Pseudomonadota bacterium]